MRHKLHLQKLAGMFYLLLFFSLQTVAQTATPPTTGDGSQENPYEISNLDQLYWLSQSDTAWGKHYIQTVDIDASATSSWHNDKGFSPIGNKNTSFTGTYNGDGHQISNLVINRPYQDYIGLFGSVQTGGKVTNLGITGATISGKNLVGGLTGKLKNATIKNCYTTGTLEATGHDWYANAGGLLGKNIGTIEACYSSMSITSDDGILGGFVGRNAGTIENCYATGAVTGTDDGRVGGFVGDNDNGTIKYSYSTGSVECPDYAHGGFNGYNHGTITLCFWDKETSGVNDSEGGTGLNTSNMNKFSTYYDAGWDFVNNWGYNPAENNSYPFLTWEEYSNDIPVTTKTLEIVEITSTSAKVQGQIISTGDSEAIAYGVCWNQSGNPTINDDTTNLGTANAAENYTSRITQLEINKKYYVRAYLKNNDTTAYGKEKVFFTLPQNSKPAGDGTENNPYQIADLENLAWMMLSDTAWDKHYTQTADIDASETNSWYSGKGLIPIGNSNTEFSGTYNGQHHKINGLYINRESSENIGMFGLIKGDVVQIEKLALTNVNITGKNNVGAIAGHNRGNIYQCYASGNVNSNVSYIHSNTGGLAGLNVDTVKSSFNKVNVSSAGHLTGGIAGKNSGSGLIINCYSQGDVSGSRNIGGIVGENWNGKIKFCYSTSLVDGSTNVGGIVGKKYDGVTKNSFWDTESSGLNQSDGGQGKTSLEMRNHFMFIDNGWDFMNETQNGEENIWGINQNENEGYPFLKWEGYSYLSPLIVNTGEVTNIDSVQATGKIKILSIDTSSITAHGMCWSTESNPTLQDNYTDKGSVTDTGVYVSNLSGLQPTTQYYVRAYVSNKDTTKYGSQVSFHTTPSFSIPAGDGSETNPYQIADLENLAWMMLSDTAWDKHYTQTADIDASETNSWYSGKGLIPIGNSNTEFSGTYNGQHHKINGLYINRESSENIGMFGLIKGDVVQIEKLALTNVNITGKNNVGAIAGHNRGNIYQCYASGNVNSNVSYIHSNTGGLAGLNVDTVKSSFNKVNVSSAGHLTGGIAGKNSGSGLIINCYSQGDVSGSRNIGGIVGENWNGKIKFCYSTSLVDGSTNVGGIVGKKYDGVTKNSFWDTESSGLNQSDGGQGKTTSEMRNHFTFIDNGWDFMNETENGEDDIWGINPNKNEGYPFLNWEGFAYQQPLIVNTGEVTNIDSVQATGKIKIRSIDTSTIKAHGICWSTASNPTLQDNYTDEGSVADTGVYASNFSGLQPTTQYYVRAYVSNNDTTKYGAQVNFYTTPSFSVPAGDGSETNPYQIASMEELTWLMVSDTAWNKHFIQTADIDASAGANWYSNKGFNPIGNTTVKFTGTYDGDTNTISNLFINRPNEKFIGLFGRVKDGAVIKNLGVTSADITGKGYVGGLAGLLSTATVKNCHTSGNLNAKGYDWMAFAGGLIGKNNGTVNACYSSMNVTSSHSFLGGIVGANRGTVENCYASGKITGTNRGRVGGFVGDNQTGTIKKSYSFGRVECDDLATGGFNGFEQGTINQCYWNTETSGLNQSKGGQGKTTSEMRNHLIYIDKGWDFMNETQNGEEDIWGINPNENEGFPFLAWQGFSYQQPLVIRTGEITNLDSTSATAEIKILSLDTSTVTDHGLCWDTKTAPTIQDNHSSEGNLTDTGSFYTNVTELNPNTTYYARVYATNSDTTTYGNERTFTTPFYYSKPAGEGSEESPYIISDLGELAWVMLSDTAWDKHFSQVADIDASGTQFWYNGNGLTPIGNATTKFTGSYNGLRHTIDSLHINRQNLTNVGLFGVSKNSKITKLSLTNVNITGKQYVGAFVGKNLGTLSECYAEGKVNTNTSEIQARAGGLTGYTNDTIRECINNVNITSAGHLIGGISGTIVGDGLIINCYNTGSVSGKDHTGGIVGQLYNGKIKNSYNVASVNGDEETGGIVGAKMSGTTSGCFWDKETSGINHSNGGTGLTSSEMKTFNTYHNAGWNFTIWGFNPAANNGYPFLKWEGFPDDIPAFVVETDQLASVAPTTATIDGAILGLGSTNPEDHGICWNTTGMPTTADNVTSLGSTDTTGEFTSQITGLEVNSEYFARTYASTNDTTVYGSVITFTTPTKTLELEGSFSAGDKIYDGTSLAEITSNSLSLTGIEGNDEVTIDTLVVHFSDSAVGENKLINITEIALEGGDKDKYHVNPNSFPAANADITPKELIVTDATVEVKTYDGTPDAVISGATLQGVISGDNVSLNNATTGTFASTNVGTSIAVSTSMTLDGGQAANYELAQPSGLTGDITAKEVTISGSFDAENKVYDATQNATISANNLTLEGYVDQDNVTLQSISANFAQAQSASNITVSITTAQLEGSDAGNYYLSVTNAPTTIADITPKELTVVNASVQDKTYDGTTDASITGASINGVISGDNVTIDETNASFVSEDVGTDIEVTPSISITGAQAANYQLTQPANLSGNITPKETTIGGDFSVEDKVYDGTEEAAVNTSNLTLEGIVSGDDVVISNFEISFAQANQGSNVVVNITTADITGAEAGNYTLSLTGAPSANATITPKELTVSGTSAEDKVYDGTTEAVITGASINGVISGDNVTIDEASGSFASKDVGTDIEVTPSITITGAQAGNYQLTQPANMTASITAKTTTIGGSFNVADKKYDGTTKATITTNDLSLDSIIGNDDVSLTSVRASFAEAGPGSGITANIENAALAGNDAGNYSLSLAGAPTTTGDITDATSIKNSTKAGISLYPNPVKDYLSIESDITIKQIKIVDMSGVAQIIKNPDNHIRTSDLEKGIYLIILKDEQGNKYQQKIIKK